LDGMLVFAGNDILFYFLLDGAFASLLYLLYTNYTLVMGICQ